MDIKTLFGKSRKSYALILVLLVLAVPLILSGCGGGGGGSSSSPSSTISGTVDGGLNPISGSDVTLCEYNNSTVHFTGCPLGGTSLGSATTSTSGSFSISYTPPSTGGSTVLYVDASGGKTGTGTTNDYIDLIAMAGSLSSLPSNLKVNEFTTVAGEELFGFANGYTDPGNKNALSVFNDYYSSLVNVSSGNPASSPSSSQTTTIINAYKILANALAGCVQNQSVCSQIAKYVNAYNLTPPTTTLQIAAMIQEFQNVSANSTASTMLENLYNIVVESKLAQSTGWTVPSSAPATVPSLEITHGGGGGGSSSSGIYQYFNGGFVPTALAAPAADGGNVFDVDSAMGVSFMGGIYDINPSSYTSPGGNLAQYITAVYNVPYYPTAMAISASGNFWVINQGGGGYNTNQSWVSKISPTETPISNGVTYIYKPLCQYNTDNLLPSAIAIGPGGNIWVANEGNNTIMELNTNCQLMTNPADPNEPAYYYSGGTIPVAIAISAHDNIWVANRGSNNVVELSSSGVELKNFQYNNTYTGTEPDAIAIDQHGDVWVANETSGNVSEISPKDNKVIGTFSVGSVDSEPEPDAIAIDDLGYVWVANFNSNNIIELSPTGSIVTTYTLGEACSSNPDAIAIILGNVWVADNSATSCYQEGLTNIVEILNAAVADQYFPYPGPQWPGSF